MSELDEALERIRGSFRSRCAEHSAALRGAMAQGDREQLHAIAHKLCGTAGTLGFSEVSEKAMILEDLLDGAAEEDDVRASVEALAALLDREAIASDGKVR